TTANNTNGLHAGYSMTGITDMVGWGVHPTDVVHCPMLATDCVITFSCSKKEPCLDRPCVFHAPFDKLGAGHNGALKRSFNKLGDRQCRARHESGSPARTRCLSSGRPGRCRGRE